MAEFQFFYFLAISLFLFDSKFLLYFRHKLKVSAVIVKLKAILIPGNRLTFQPVKHTMGQTFTVKHNLAVRLQISNRDSWEIHVTDGEKGPSIKS